MFILSISDYVQNTFMIFIVKQGVAIVKRGVAINEINMHFSVCVFFMKMKIVSKFPIVSIGY